LFHFGNEIGWPNNEPHSLSTGIPGTFFSRLEQFDVILIIQLSQTIMNSEACGIFPEGDAVLGSDSNEIQKISIFGL
jgi:hypothetical protein